MFLKVLHLKTSCVIYSFILESVCARRHLKNVCELLNMRAPKISTVYKNDKFWCMGKIFCMEFQKYT